MSKKRTELMDRVVFKTQYVVEDLYSTAPPKQKKIIDNMSDKELEKFIDKSSHGWKKGFEWGLGDIWPVVAQTCISESEWPDKEDKNES